MSPVQTLGRFTLFCALFLRSSWSRRPPPGETLEEAWKIGIRSLPVLLIISVFVGTNLSIQGYFAFKPLGGQKLVGMFVALAGLRELAPIIAASMVAAKAGTEMASQIAVMRIREQIDALEVMAVNPHWYLITPRLLAILLVMPALSTLASATMMLASYVVAVYQLDLSGAAFLEFAVASTRPIDLILGCVKALFFGTLICLISCYCGFYSKPGPAGVGAATNTAVVTAAVSCVIINYFLSELVYG